MKIVVLEKQVPDSTEITVDKKTGALIRDGVPAITNPDDLAGLEAALELKDKNPDTEVVVMTMGLPKAAEMLKEGVAMGADKGVLLTDRVLGGSDTCATSIALAAALKKVGFDLVIAGRQAIDGDTAQVGPQTAERLDIPQVTYVDEILEVKEDSITVKRSLEDVEQIVTAKLPCVITTLSGMNKPRYMQCDNIVDLCKEAIWGSFIVGHIILFAMYLIYYYGLINKIEKENLIMLFAKYIRISSFFYIISSVAVLYTMVGEIKTDEIAPVMVILLLNFIACIYTFVENKKFNNLSNELLAKMDRQELKQYIYRKNALIAVYAMIFSISMGTLYMCSIDFINENITVVIFILEFVFNMILYGNCYYKIKSKFMPEDNSQYNKWQLIVPKRVGVGYTFNFGCPLTYVIYVPFLVSFFLCRLFQ